MAARVQIAIEEIAILFYNVATKMVGKEKVLLKFLNNPSCLNYLKIERLLLQLGFEKIEAKGSHKKFKHPQLINDLIIPVHNNDCKEFYKNLAAKTIKKII